MRNRSDRDSPRDRCTRRGIADPVPCNSQRPPDGDLGDPKPRLLSVATVADRLDVSTKTIRRWIEAGELRIHRLGRSVRISETDLQKFLEEHRQ